MPAALRLPLLHLPAELFHLLLELLHLLRVEVLAELFHLLAKLIHSPGIDLEIFHALAQLLGLLTKLIHLLRIDFEVLHAFAEFFGLPAKLLHFRGTDFEMRIAQLLSEGIGLILGGRSGGVGVSCGLGRERLREIGIKEWSQFSRFRAIAGREEVFVFQCAAML